MEHPKLQSHRIIFASIRPLMSGIVKADERVLDSHRLPNRIKHVKSWLKK